jgi:hypothetical protein
LLDLLKTLSNGCYTLDESWEKWLGGKILVCVTISGWQGNIGQIIQLTVLFEVLLGSSHQLDGGKLVALCKSAFVAVCIRKYYLTHEPQIG